MNESLRLKSLRITLVLVGIIFIFGIYLLMNIWPSGWTWHTGHSDYPMMIVGVYATLGIFLLIAARNPLAHLSLIWFTVWSSLVHAAIMLYQSFSDPANQGHLVGDVPALLIVAIVLAVLVPREPAAADGADGAGQGHGPGRPRSVARGIRRTAQGMCW